jgi:hypothetical protein
MKEVFEEDLRQSKQIAIDAWSKRSLWEKVKEQFFSLFRRRL